MTELAAKEKDAEKPYRIHGVSLIFDFGNGHESKRGHTHGNYSQSDVVDTYGRRLIEELDNENVRSHHINTRKENVSEQDRLRNVPANYLPLVLSCGWHDNPRIHNSSTIEFSGQGYYQIASHLAFCLSEWGRGYVWGHRVSRPILVNSEYNFVRIKPFALNGPHAEDYLLRMEQLGKSIGYGIGEYLLRMDMGRVKLTK